jgi:hypothetical protein
MSPLISSLVDKSRMSPLISSLISLLQRLFLPMGLAEADGFKANGRRDQGCEREATDV